MQKAIKLSVLLAGEKDQLEAVSQALTQALVIQGVRYVLDREAAKLSDFVPKGDPHHGERVHSRRR